MSAMTWNLISDPKRTNNAVFLIDLKSQTFCYVNDYACKKLGYSRDELLQMGVRDIDPLIDEASLQKIAEQVMKQGCFLLESYHLTKDGHLFPVEVNGNIFEYQGESFGFFVARDLTERKQKDDQLALLDYAFNHVNEAMFLIDENAQFIQVNEKACRSLGYSHEELLGMSIFDIDPDYTQQHWIQNLNDIAKGIMSVRLETRHRTKDGRIFPIEIVSNRIYYQGHNYKIAMARDITERKAAEKQLALLNYALDHIKEEVWLIDENARFHYVNPKACRSIGRPYQEMLQLTVPEIKPDYGLEQWQQDWQLIKTTGSSCFETSHQSKEGRIFPVEVNTNYFEFDGKGYSLTLSHDLTERKQEEAQFALLNYAFNYVDEGIFLVNNEAQLLQVNEKACHSLGYSREELLSMSIFDIDPDFTREGWQKLLADYEKGKKSITIETRHRSKDGVVFPVEVRGYYIAYQGQKYSFAMVRNITERKAAEKQLALLNYALDHVKESVWLIDENAKLQYVNQEACHSVRYTCEELLQLNIPSIDADFSIARWHEHWQELKARKTLRFETAHKTKEGHVFPVEVNANYFEFGGKAYNLALSHDITERKQAQETLKFVAQRGWKNQNESFLTALAYYLAQIFDVDYVIIDKIGVPPTEAETVALYAKGQLLPNIQYSLKGTPCDNVMNGKVCCYPKNIPRLFPEDSLLAEMQVESYAGLPLWDTTGNVIGLIAVLHSKPLKDTDFITSILQLVATSAAAELERQHSEQRLLDSHHFLEQIINTLADPVFVKDRKHRWVLLNQAFCKFIGHPLEQLLGKSVYDFLPSSQADVFWVQDENVFSSCRETINEEEITDAAGVLRTIITKKTCYTDNNGQQFLVGIITDISERKRNEARLQQSELEFRTLVDNLPTTVLRYDCHLQRIYANSTYLQIMGGSDPELLNKPLEETWVATNLSVEAYKAILHKVMRDGEKQEVLLEWTDRNGELICHVLKIVPEYTLNGQIQSVLVLGFDFSEQRRQQLIETNRQRVFEKMARNKDLDTILKQVALYVESAKAGRYCAILLLDEAQHHLQLVAAPSFPESYFAKSCALTLDISSQHCMGWATSALYKQRVIIENIQQHPCAWQCQDFIREMNVLACWSEPIISSSNQLIGVVTLYLNQAGLPNENDVAYLLKASHLSAIAIERKRIEQQMQHQANYDVLTGLPNRWLFNDRLQEEINKAERRGDKVAVLFIDLDHFKDVNDTLGHQIGDNLLIDAARRIQDCVRKSDTVARLSGDEFVVILPELDSAPPVDRIAEAIISAIAQAFKLGEYYTYVSASIGIAMYPQDSPHAETLVSYADQAMYAAKQAGRNNFNFFTRSMQEQAQQHLYLVNSLRDALEKNQFEVHYQPIIEVSSGKTLKAEALLRWHHPVLGMVSPAVFIPLAEETDLIQSIGSWVFCQAADMVKRWNTLNNETKPRKVSINMSPRQLIKGNGDQIAIDYLQAIALDSTHIVIEITEGLLLDNSPHITEKLERLRNSGIQLSLDDFGTGYSAMAYLRKFDINYLKIDRSFVRELETNSNDRAITEAIVVMAHRLGLKVIAEGVETEGQRALVATMGCEYIQGYFYAKPMPIESFLSYVLVSK